MSTNWEPEGCRRSTDAAIPGRYCEIANFVHLGSIGRRAVRMDLRVKTAGMRAHVRVLQLLGDVMPANLHDQGLSTFASLVALHLEGRPLYARVLFTLLYFRL